MKSVSLIMSVYNEQNTVSRVLEKLRNIDFITELIIVDNGSTDSSYELIQNAKRNDKRIKVLQIKKNKGLGCAINLAIKNTTGDIIVRQDADLEYDPEELINLVKIIDEDLADVVYGSRVLVRKAHRVHYFYSYIANKILTFLSNLLTNLFLSDVETAAKAFKGDIARSIDWKSKGFEIENEMTIKLKRIGCTFYEVPYSYYGRPFSEGKKIRSVDGFRAVFFIIFYRISSFFVKQNENI